MASGGRKISLILGGKWAKPVMVCDGKDLVVLVIDIGSSSVRGMIYGCDGRPVSGLASRVEHSFETDAEGKAVLDAEEVQARVESVIDDVLRQAGPMREQIGAVGMATLVGNALALDHHGDPLTPIYTYADSRSASDLRTWQSTLGDLEPEVYERTGCPQHTAYMPARFLWFLRTDGRHVARWSDLGGFLYGRWFGLPRVPCSYSVASWSGLLDRRTLCWDSLILSQLPVSPDQLPELADYDQPCRGLSDSWARRWPALRDRPFFLAVGDGAAANIGTGGVNPDRLVVTIGSTAAIRLTVPGTPAVPRGLWCYRVDRGLSLLGGALAEGGNVGLWLRDTLRMEMTAVESELASLEPDSHHLTVLPFWYGERSPGWSTDARAAIVGLSAATRPVDIVRACLESIAYRLALIADPILEVSPTVTGLIASGNALLSSPTWLQILADVLGRPIRASAEPEGTSRGVALMALRGLGVIRSYEQLPVVFGATYKPRDACHAVYRKALHRQQHLYAQLIAR